MKQIVQNPKSGKLELLEVPIPAVGPGQVLVRNHFSVVSPGTEKMALDFARKSLLGKARSRPDLVKQVLHKVQQEGPLPTYRAVMNRLDALQPLGYSTAGVVEAVGADVVGFSPGDRVACAGAGYANHAEWVAVPENLVVPVPPGVTLEDAAFATLGAIALQGLRIAEPTLGEVAGVIGLGLIGQIAAQLARANGCRVLGIDLDPHRMKQALDQGADWTASPSEDLGPWRDRETQGHGADFVLVTAASDSSAPIQLAADLCRMKGRVSVVGATAMDLDRRSFYDKELDLRMSRSYGPGRYDRRYEELGLDFPLPWVRWTENRNLRAFLDLTASGAVRPSALDVERVPFEQAETAYEELARGERRSLALLFAYQTHQPAARSIELKPRTSTATRADAPGVAFLGAGNYAKAILLPALDGAGAMRRVSVVTATGPSSRHTAERFQFARCGTDPALVLEDPDVQLVFIATQHDSHAPLAAAALRAGKAVWLEKPAAITPEQLDELAAAVEETQGFLAIGYNRRFSPHSRAIRDVFAGRRGPLSIRYTVAPGSPPAGTWHTDPNAGGGRVLGEVCHFTDLCAWLVGAPPIQVFARALGRDPELDDSLVAMLGFADGSTATIEYLANTDKQLPKERFEVSGEDKTVTCDNFRRTQIVGGKTTKTLNQDKGQATAVAAVLEAVRRGEPSPFSLAEIIGVSRATFAMLESARSGAAVRLEEAGT